MKQDRTHDQITQDAGPVDEMSGTLRRGVTSRSGQRGWIVRAGDHTVTLAIGSEGERIEISREKFSRDWAHDAAVIEPDDPDDGDDDGLTDEQRAGARAIATDAAPAPTVMPVDVAEALHGFIVPGLGQLTESGPTIATPQALAVMFADLAARFGVLGLPAEHRLRVTVYVQPEAPRPVYVSDAREAAYTAVVDAAAAVLAPGVEPHREILGASVHHALYASTPAGLRVSAFTCVEPSAGERAFMDEVRKRRTEATS